MKFALLGVDPDALELIGQLCQVREHELCVVYDVRDQLPAVREVAPRVEIGDEPEALLARPEIDAVIVATSTDPAMRERQLRTLVQGGLRLVVMLPICDSLTAYELELIRSDTSSVMIPYSTGRGHPAIKQLGELLQGGTQSSIGAVEQIVFERHMATRQRETVIPQLCRDGHLIGRLIGSLEGVSATGDGQDPYKNLSVGMSGNSGLSARWNIVPTSGPSVGTITLHGEFGKATLELSEGQPWRLEVSRGDEHSEVQSWPDWDVTQPVIDAINGQRSDIGTWFEACRDLEIADHVAASLRRKRTIAIRRDGNPEENAFKGIMAAGGCLILLVCLLVVLGFAIVEGFRMPLSTSPADVLDAQDTERSRWHILLRMWPVYPLLAFLAMQALLLVAKSGRTEPITDAEE